MHLRIPLGTVGLGGVELAYLACLTPMLPRMRISDAVSPDETAVMIARLDHRT